MPDPNNPPPHLHPDTAFHNEVLMVDTLPSFEQATLTGLSKDYKKIVWWNILTGVVFSFIILAFAGWVITSDLLMTGIFVLPVLLWLLVRMITFGIAFRRKKYALREKDIIYQSGWLFKDVIVVPYLRIQHISLHESWLARRYELANVRLYTTGDDVEIPGLPKATALRIQQLVLDKINALGIDAGVMDLKEDTTPGTIEEEPFTEDKNEQDDSRAQSSI